MKNILFLFTLTSLVSCQEENDRKHLNEVYVSSKEDCMGSFKKLITKVDNCSVYQVYVDRYDSRSSTCLKADSVNTYNVHFYSFLYTSCPSHSVKFDCGKNCTQTNTTMNQDK